MFTHHVKLFIDRGGFACDAVHLPMVRHGLSQRTKQHDQVKESWDRRFKITVHGFTKGIPEVGIYKGVFGLWIVFEKYTVIKEEQSGA